MLNRSILPRLLALAMLVLGVGIVGAQEAPTAVRVRIAHLAPFPGSDNATITVEINGTAVGGALDPAIIPPTSRWPEPPGRALSRFCAMAWWRSLTASRWPMATAR